MAGLPRSIIKKYGVTKRAWAVFRGSKSSSRASARSKRTEVRTMARRKYSGFKRRKSSSGSSGGKFSPLVQAALSGAIVGAALKYTPAQYNTPMVRIGAGGAAAYFGKGIVKKSGEVLLALEVARMTGNALSGISVTQDAQNADLFN